MRYFSKETLSHLKPQKGLSELYQRRALDVMHACKPTNVYGKYNLARLHRELLMSEEKTSYQQAEQTAYMMNQMTIFHSSPSDFLHTKEESVNECIDTYKEFRQFVKEYADEYFVPNIVEEFCKKVSGKTAKEIIQEETIKQAKLLLRDNSLSIKEVADRLNFTNQSHFGTYFHRHTGLSPQQFRGEK